VDGELRLTKRELERTAKSCVLTAAVLGVKFVRSKASQGRRWQKPFNRGEIEVSRKPSRRKAGMSRYTCMLVCVFFYAFAHETAGASPAARFSCALLV